MTTSPSQRDYGHEASVTPLVPGSLRLYRHFKVEVDALAPMNTMFQNRNPYASPSPLYHAECMKDVGKGTTSWATQVLGNSNSRYASSAGKPHGEAPVKGCQCGFYAHYDQTTDFYPSFDWNVELSGSRVIVKAVVEASGRVVMGTKGVRAEKVKIVAIAPDWTKYRSSEWTRAVENAKSYDEYRSLRDDPAAFKPTATEHEVVFQLMVRIANRYNLDLYVDPEDLHKAYPPQDVTELLKTDATEIPKRKYGYLE